MPAYDECVARIFPMACGLDHCRALGGRGCKRGLLGAALGVAGRVHAAAPVAAPVLSVETAEVARAFGALKVAASAQVAPDVASRFRLLGVAADREGGGAALIAVDGKLPRSYRTGAAFDGQFVLQSIDASGVQIGPAAGGAGFRLMVPSRPLAVNGPPRTAEP